MCGYGVYVGLCKRGRYDNDGLQHGCVYRHLCDFGLLDGGAKMKSAYLSDIAVRVPINRAARNAIDGDFVHYEPNIQDSRLESDFPFQVRNDLFNFSKQSSFVDLTGLIFGRLKVCGLTEFGGNIALWSARCGCGRYVLRKSKTLKKTAHECVSMCSHCLSLEILKRDYDRKVKRGMRAIKRRYFRGIGDVNE